MITTVNLNPCIDKTIYVENFTENQLNRVAASRADVGGKGVNVGIVLRQISDMEVACLGFNYRENGSMLTNHLDEIGLDYDFETVEGSIRTNIKLLDTVKGTFTEINEKGATVSEEATLALQQKIVTYGQKSKIMTFSGSAPENLPAHIYREFLENLKDSAVQTVLDVEGAYLLEGVKAGPFMIKPNLYEFSNAFGLSRNDLREVISLARRVVIEYGVTIICISMGKKGACICDKREAYFAPGLQLAVRGVQGAGDSMVAGLCIAYEKGLGLSEMLRYGVAAASASLTLEGTQLCDRVGFEKMLSQTTMEPIRL